MKTFQPLNMESPAALAHRLRCAWWRLPAGEWRVERGALGVRHGAMFSAVAQVPGAAEQRFAERLVELLEGVPALLDAVAPLPPERPTGKPGSKYRKHQDRLIKKQAEEILALREELVRLHPEPRHIKEGGNQAGDDDAVLAREGTAQAAAPSQHAPSEEALRRLQRELELAAREEGMLRELVTALARPTR